jgi:hypothetical protein
MNNAQMLEHYMDMARRAVPNSMLLNVETRDEYIAKVAALFEDYVTNGIPGDDAEVKPVATEPAVEPAAPAKRPSRKPKVKAV